jgi:tripartite ATP-independent transporter DctM subunit
MAGPVMMRAGYDPKLSAGAIAAGGTLGILIPPSVMLVVMGPTLGVPVNFLYAACLVPGFLLAGMYAAYCLGRSFFNPSLGPPVPVEERVGSAWEVIREVLVGVVPLATLIAFTLGTILGGLATATEAASCGAAGATLLALLYRKLTWDALRNAGTATLLTTSMVLFLAVASNVFGAVFTRLGGSDLIANALLSVPLPDLGKLLLVMALLFVLGWPFEWPAIILVFLPICLPVVEKLDLGLARPELLIWFGVLVAVNLQTAFLSPPVAMSAYYLKNVMPQWGLTTIYRGMAEFMVIQLVCLAVLILWPEVVLWLPRAMR